MVIINISKKKKIYIALIILLSISAVYIFSWEIKDVPPKADEYYRMVNYNLKYADESDITFTDRKELMVTQLLSYNADIITLQEANYGWMNSDNGLPSLLDGYNYVGVGREDGIAQGEFAPIFYLSEKFNVITENTIWLSETPSSVSIGWDASTYRIMTSATLQDKETGEIFTIYNTHLDHKGSTARTKSINLILEEVGENNNPHFLAGDMNFPSFFPEYFTVTSKMDDVKNLADSSMKHGTVNYNNSNKFFQFLRIDYIFASENDFKVINYRVDPSYQFLNQPISDHFPIIIDFSISK